MYTVCPFILLLHCIKKKGALCSFGEDILIRGERS